MPTRKNPICACEAPRRNGRCTAVPSCDDFKRPGMRQISLAAKLRQRERRAHLGLPTRQEVADGATRAMTRTVRGGGDATNPATLEAELASGRW